MLPGFGLAGQAALRACKVALVGLGGLGCPVATYLAAAGVGHLVLIDHDRVDLSNLHRQVLYTPEDVGRPKVEAAGDHLRKFEPALELTLHERKVSPQDGWLEAALSDVAVVVDGSDNFPTRYAVNAAAVRRRLPLSYGSVYRYTGEVSTFLVGEGPCYACLHPAPPPEGTAPSCAEGGVLGVLPGMIGMLQATEVLKLLGVQGELLSGRLLSLDVRRSPSFREWRFRRRLDCHVCGNGAPPRAGQTVGRGKVPQVSLTRSRELTSQGYLLVDIRSPEELAFGRLAGSLHRHGAQLDEFLAAGPRRAVFACKSGGRSGALVATLREQGWTEAFSLAGDWCLWAAEGESLIPY
jgi:adenylyltransferase/sulfurtransferase